MNMKIVVVWAFVIILCAGLGIFGLVNQDLLVINDDTPYVPVERESENIHTCSKQMELGTTTYRFLVDATTQSISRVTVTFAATSGNIDAYTAASNLSIASVPGLTTTLSGGLSNFNLMVQINTSTFDKNSLGDASSDLDVLGIILDNITDYQSYKNLINTVDSFYTCD